MYGSVGVVGTVFSITFRGERVVYNSYGISYIFFTLFFRFLCEMFREGSKSLKRLRIWLCY